MSQIKAVVLEKSGSRYTVLAQDGTFRQVHRRLNAEVGEEVQIQRWTEYLSGVRLWAGAVALFLLVLTTLLGWTLYQAPTAVALLSVDINPSLQLTLDNHGHLLKFQTQNEDAKRMLGQIDLKGKPIEEVLEQIVIQAYDQKFLSTQQPWVVIGYSPMNNKTLEQMPKVLNENQLSSWVAAIGMKKGLTPQVAVFSLTYQEQELAQKGDLTLGEYALWQTANKAGVVTQPEKLKDTSERIQLLENPQVQAQIKVEKNERQSLGSMGKPGEDGAEKVLPKEKPFSPIKVLDPGMDKSRSEDGDKAQQKDRGNDNYTQKDSDNDQDKQKAENNENSRQKDLDKAKVEDKQKAIDQEKYQNEAQNSEKKESQRTKYNKIYDSPIPPLGNSESDTFHTFKVPEFDRDNQQRR